MKNISIKIDDELFKRFSVACAELGIQKKSAVISFIRNFIEQKEEQAILQLAEKRLEKFEKRKPKTISHKNAWR